MPASTLTTSSEMEEAGLQADFYAYLAEYVQEHRRYSAHSDLEVRYKPEEKFLKEAEDRLREAARNGREHGGAGVGGGGERQRKEDTAMARRWEVEADTWMLIELRRGDLDYPSLGPFRSSSLQLIPGELKHVQDEELEEEGLVEKSMLKVLEDFLNHRKEFRRLLLLVTWLELLRERDLWMLQDEINGLEGGFDMWPSTCQQEGVPALDPDHPYHTRRPLASVDEQQDFLLLERIWRFLRAGRLDEAINLCHRCGQHWRAASISGSDPWEVYVPEDGGHQGGGGGGRRGGGRDTRRGGGGGGGGGAGALWVNNLRPLLWRRMCATLAETLLKQHPNTKEKSVKMERTVYAALALEPQLMVRCAGEYMQGWEDQAWAFFRAKMEWELQLTMQQLQGVKRRYSDLYPDLVESEASFYEEEEQCMKTGRLLRDQTVAQIFRDVEDAAAREALDLTPERRVQAGVMAGELRAVLVAVAQSSVSRDDPRLLRLWTHVALFVIEAEGGGREEGGAFVGQPQGVEAAVWEIVTRYMQVLVQKASHMPLVALYASFLPRKGRREALAGHWKQEVHASSVRAACLEEAFRFMPWEDVGVVVAEVLEHYRHADDSSLSALFSSLAFSLPSSTPGGKEGARRELVGLPPIVGKGEERQNLRNEDTLRIKALEWLLNPRLQRQAIVHLTAFLRRAVAASASSSPDERGHGVIFSEALLAILRFGHGVLGASKKKEEEEEEEEGGREGGEEQTIAGFGSLVYDSHVEEWESWRLLGASQEAFLEWKVSETAFDAQRRHVQRMVESATKQPAPEQILEFSIEGLVQAVSRLADLATKMAEAMVNAATRLMTILKRADIWLSAGLSSSSSSSSSFSSSSSSSHTPRSPPQGGGRENAVSPSTNDVEALIFRREAMMDREQELRQLKATCLPELVHLLHQTLHDTARCVEDAFVSPSALGRSLASPSITAAAASSSSSSSFSTTTTSSPSLLATTPEAAARRAEQADVNADRFRRLAAKCYMWSMQIGETVADPRTKMHEYFPRGRFAAPPAQVSLLKEAFTLEEMMGCVAGSGRALLRLLRRTEWAELARTAKEEAPWGQPGGEEEEEEEEEEQGDAMEVTRDERRVSGLL